MSLMPCDVCQMSRSGRLLGFYFTVIRDGIRWSRRLKTCAECVDKLCATYGRNWSDGFILNRFSNETQCSECGEKRGATGTLHPMYVTCYSAKGTRYDYYGTYCDTHATALIDTFALQAGERHAA